MLTGANNMKDDVESYLATIVDGFSKISGVSSTRHSPWLPKACHRRLYNNRYLGCALGTFFGQEISNGRTHGFADP